MGMLSAFQGRASRDGILGEFSFRVRILGHWVDNLQNPERIQIEKEIAYCEPN
jgi:hypothetical protein